MTLVAPRPLQRSKKGGLLAPSPARRQVKTMTKDEGLVRDRREQLIRAAIKVFGEKGFHQTTVRDIGRAAHLTQGTIYNYVRSKEDILFLVCDRVVTEYQDSVRRALSGNGNATERLAEALPGSRREIFAGGGHAFMAQEPVRLATTVNAWLGR